MGMLTFNPNKDGKTGFVTINITDDNNHVENLTKGQLVACMNVVSEDANLSAMASAGWSFDRAGKKNGYLLSIVIEDTSGAQCEVSLATDRARNASRVFKSFDALERVVIDCGFDSIHVDFG